MPASTCRTTRARWRRPGALRGGVLAALVVATAPLGACHKPPSDAGVKPQVDLLGSMLADETAINAIMGSNAFRVYNTYRSLPGWPQGDVYSQPECLAVEANAMEPVYRGSHYGQLRGTQLADNGHGTENSVDEAVIGFDDAGDAQAFIAATTHTWTRCANSTLTITSTDRRPRHWRMGSPRVVDGVQVVDADDPDWTSGWRTSHAMRATNNVVIDVRVTGYPISDQAVRVVDAIAGRNRL